MSLEEEDEEGPEEQGGSPEEMPEEGPAGRKRRFVWAGDEALTREWIFAAAAKIGD
jgi:hypothetical protein